MKKVYILYNTENQIGYGAYESLYVAQEIARMMSEQLNEEWKVKELHFFANPF